MSENSELLADLDFLLQRIRVTHPDPYRANPESVWDDTYEEITASWEDYDIYQQIGSMCKIIALLDDSHSRIEFGEFNPHQRQIDIGPDGLNLVYPLQIRAFYDGVFLVQATSEFTQYLGSKIIEINGLPVREVFDRIEPFLPTENLMGKVLYSCRAIRYPFFLYISTIIDSIDAKLEITTDTTTLNTSPINPVDTNLELSSVRDKAGTPVQYPLGSEKHLTSTYITEKQMLYARLAKIRDSDDLSISKFATQIDQQLQDLDVTYLVLDIRDNGGGNNFLGQPLVEMIIQNPEINQLGRLFCLINRASFSAAINFASDLERYTWALFVGEPFMAPPNHFGDPVLFTLPHSGIPVRISSLYWQSSEPQDSRPSILPDIKIQETFQQYIDNDGGFVDLIANYSLPDGWDRLPAEYSARVKIWRDTQTGDIGEYFPWLEQ